MKFFITGGTGLIGRWTVARLSQQGHQIRVLARNAKSRETEYFDWIQQHGGETQHIELLDGDLSKSDLGLSNNDIAQLQGTEVIYHMGAAFSWGLSTLDARKITVDGSQELIKLACKLEHLKQFIHMSGYMIAAPHIWELLGLDKIKQDARQPLTDSQIHLLYKKFGAYEASKIESHFLIQYLAFKNNIPLTGILLSSVIGDSKTGEIDQPHGIPMLIKSIWNGQMPVIPGTPKDWIPLVTVDYLVSFIIGVITLPETVGKNYVVLDNETPPLFELIQLIANHIGDKPPTRFASKKLIQLFLNLGLGKIFESNAETLDFVQPYQFNVQSTQQISKKLGLAKPDIRESILKLVDFLVATDFGELPIKDHKNIGKYLQVANTQTFIEGNREKSEFVLLHGMPLNSRSWEPLREELATSILAADIPNVSRSKGRYETRLEWMNALSKHQAHPVSIIAHSWGTAFALDYSVGHPSKVDKLILISPYFLQRPTGVITKLPFMGTLLKYSLNREQFAKRIISDITDTNQVDYAFNNTRRPGVLSSILKTLRKVGTFQHRNRLYEQLENVKIPTLIIHGSNDPLIEKLPENPNLIVKDITSAGHSPHLTHQDIVALLVKKFTIQQSKKSDNSEEPSTSLLASA